MAPGPTAMAEEADSKNGIPNGRPHTPTENGLALTEYSAQPSPPSERKRAKMNRLVPDDLLLPDGTPDVSSSSDTLLPVFDHQLDNWPCSEIALPLAVAGKYSGRGALVCGSHLLFMAAVYEHLNLTIDVLSTSNLSSDRSLVSVKSVAKSPSFPLST
jgi:hypothetical protein